MAFSRLPRGTVRLGDDQDEWIEIQLSGKWSPLGGDLKVSQAILQMEAKGYKRCQIKLHGRDYIIDLTTMKQKNIESKRERPLRRARGHFQTVLDCGHWGSMPVDSRATVSSSDSGYPGGGGGSTGSAGDPPREGRSASGGGGKPSLHHSTTEKDLQAKLDHLRAAYPYTSVSKIEAALRKCAGDPDLAVGLLLDSAPDLVADPEGWFAYFDYDKNGTLEVEEVQLGSQKTCQEHGIDETYGRTAIDDLWHEYVVEQGSTCISKEDFLREGGFRQAFLTRLGLLDEVGEKDADEAAGPSRPGGTSALGEEDYDDSEEGVMDYIAKELKILHPGGVLGVFFAARMDCPSLDYTSTLKERYLEYKEKGLEFRVLFVSCDRSPADFEVHRKSMPSDWAVIDHKKRGIRWQLMRAFNVTSVPTLRIVGKNGERVTSEGCERVAADPTGVRFPWDSEGHETHEPDAVRQFWSQLRRCMKSDVDDEEMGREARKMPLTQESYERVASFKSNHAMRTFFWRVLELKGWDVLDEVKFGQLVWEHSGIRRTQTLQALLKDFTDADWVDKHTVIAKIETPDEAPPSVAVTDTGGGGASDAGPMPTITITGRPGGRSMLYPPAGAAGGAGGPGGGLGGIPEGGSTGGGADAGDMPTATMTKRLMTMTMLKGKGKGRTLYDPTAPKPGDSAAAPDDSEAASAAAPKGAGKAAPPAKGKAPAPKGAGKAPGKAPVPKGAGKGKGAMPTRPDKEAWKSKRTNKLHWKRYILPSPFLQKSLFNTAEPGCDAEVDELAIEEEILAKTFEQTSSKDKDPASKLDGGDAEPAPKYPLWSGTERVAPSGRRQDLAFIALKWQRPELGGSGQLRSEILIKRLVNQEFQEILSDPYFERDDLDMLADKLEGITGEEREKLLSIAASETFEWDENVEGFYTRLLTGPNVSEGLRSLRGHLDIEAACAEYSSTLQSVKESVELVLDSASLRRMLRKLLSIGNHLNAGDKNLGCADGFDAITLVQKTILIDMPKGNDNVSLLHYMNEHEVSEEDREQLAKVGAGLSQWKLQASDDAPDQADIEEIQNMVGAQSRQLSKLTKLSKELPFFEAKIKEHETSISDLDMFLDEMRCRLQVLQAWVVHEIEQMGDDRKTAFPTGKVLSTLGAFAVALSKQKPAVRLRRLRGARHPPAVRRSAS